MKDGLELRNASEAYVERIRSHLRTMHNGAQLIAEYDADHAAVAFESGYRAAMADALEDSRRDRERPKAPRSP
jgi:hypothetical protein